jgi:hypothetical protein
MRKNPRRILSPQRLPFRHPGKLNKMNSLSSTQRSVKSSLCPLLPNFLGCLCEVLVRSSIVALKDRVSQMSGDTPCNEWRALLDGPFDQPRCSEDCGTEVAAT